MQPRTLVPHCPLRAQSAKIFIQVSNILWWPPELCGLPYTTCGHTQRRALGNLDRVYHSAHKAIFARNSTVHFAYSYTKSPTQPVCACLVQLFVRLFVHILSWSYRSWVLYLQLLRDLWQCLNAPVVNGTVLSAVIILASAFQEKLLGHLNLLT